MLVCESQILLKFSAENPVYGHVRSLSMRTCLSWKFSPYILDGCPDTKASLELSLIQRGYSLFQPPMHLTSLELGEMKLFNSLLKGSSSLLPALQGFPQASTKKNWKALEATLWLMGLDW